MVCRNRTTKRRHPTRSRFAADLSLTRRPIVERRIDDMAINHENWGTRLPHPSQLFDPRLLIAISLFAFRGFEQFPRVSVISFAREWCELTFRKERKTHAADEPASGTRGMVPRGEGRDLLFCKVRCTYFLGR